MKLTVFNGSPKRKKSNTAKMLDSFLAGFVVNPGNDCEVHYIYDNYVNMDQLGKVFMNSKYSLIAMPLHFNAMPSKVKEFIEAMGIIHKDKEKRAVGFFVQSGFVESKHSKGLEKYFIKLANLLEVNYLGTIIMPGSEGINKETCFFTKSNLEGMYQIGEKFGKTKLFDERLLIKYEKVSEAKMLYNSIIKKLVILYVNFFHWDELLKKNRVLQDKFEKPYIGRKNL